MFIGLGGNTAGTLEAFGRVRWRLEQLLDHPRFSSLYRSAPQLDEDQEPFWNAVAAGDWPSGAAGLLERLLMTEAGEGRLRDPLRPKGPRVLDLDLLVFGDQVIRTPRLSVPHPALSLRRFALEPLVELDQRAQDPVSGQSWRVLLAQLPPQGVDRTDRTW